MWSIVSDVPQELRHGVVTEAYRLADELDWSALTDRQRTALYDRWLDAPAIGGQLTRFLTRERARVWLKDGPMKEYARARNGIGPFADFATSRFPTPGQMARQLFGQSWDSIDPIHEKPLRCRVTNGQKDRLLIWGPPLTLRDLVWAGINAMVDQEPTPLLIIAIPFGQHFGEAEKRRHANLCQVAGLEVQHLVVRATKVTSPIGR
jgi:hypothetical protein